MKRRVLQSLAYAVATVVSALFLYPFWWMLISSFRTTKAVMSEPLRLWPEQVDFGVLSQIARVGGVELWRIALNSLVITTLSTLIGVIVTAFGAYALTRRPKLPGFGLLRFGFLLTIMYPYMLLVIPAYIVMFKLGLLGSYSGIILFLALGPLQFFLFEQLFRVIPTEVIEAAQIDGANEARILWHIVMPMAAPIVATATLITFLLNWSQWFPVLVVSTTPQTYTLPVALMLLNGELGANFQGIMMLAVLTTVPVAVLFVLTQRRVMEGMAAGAVKG